MFCAGAASAVVCWCVWIGMFAKGPMGGRKPLQHLSTDNMFEESIDPGLHCYGEVKYCAMDNADLS